MLCKYSRSLYVFYVVNFILTLVVSSQSVCVCVSPPVYQGTQPILTKVHYHCLLAPQVPQQLG